MDERLRSTITKGQARGTRSPTKAERFHCKDDRIAQSYLYSPQEARLGKYPSSGPSQLPKNANFKRRSWRLDSAAALHTGSLSVYSAAVHSSASVFLELVGHNFEQRRLG